LVDFILVDANGMRFESVGGDAIFLEENYKMTKMPPPCINLSSYFSIPEKQKEVRGRGYLLLNVLVYFA